MCGRRTGRVAPARAAASTSGSPPAAYLVPLPLFVGRFLPSVGRIRDPSRSLGRHGGSQERRWLHLGLANERQAEMRVASVPTGPGGQHCWKADESYLVSQRVPTTDFRRRGRVSCVGAGAGGSSMRTRLWKVRDPELPARELILARDGTFAMIFRSASRSPFEEWKGKWSVVHGSGGRNRFKNDDLVGNRRATTAVGQITAGRKARWAPKMALSQPVPRIDFAM